jgi:hypothetical protein
LALTRARLGEVVARDLAAGVGRRLAVRLAPGEAEAGEGGLLLHLAQRRGERLLAGVDAALGEVPVAKGAQQQVARLAAVAAHDHGAGGATAGSGGAGQGVTSAQRA